MTVVDASYAAIITFLFYHAKPWPSTHKTCKVDSATLSGWKVTFRLPCIHDTEQPGVDCTQKIPWNWVVALCSSFVEKHFHISNIWNHLDLNDLVQNWLTTQNSWLEHVETTQHAQPNLHPPQDAFQIFWAFQISWATIKHKESTIHWPKISYVFFAGSIISLKQVHWVMTHHIFVQIQQKTSHFRLKLWAFRTGWSEPDNCRDGGSPCHTPHIPARNLTNGYQRIGSGERISMYFLSNMVACHIHV